MTNAGPEDPSSSSPALDYAQRSLRSRRQRFSTVTFVALLIPVLLLTLALGPLAKRFERIFLDFNTAIPGVTVLLFDSGKLFRRGGWVGLWVAALSIPLAIAPLLSTDPGRHPLYSRVVLALSIIATILLLALVIVGFFLPLIADINALSGK